MNDLPTVRSVNSTTYSMLLHVSKHITIVSQGSLLSDEYLQLYPVCLYIESDQSDLVIQS
jgi:hypothetical protein